MSNKKYYIDININNTIKETLGPFSFEEGSNFFVNKLPFYSKQKTSSDFLLSSIFYLKKDNKKIVLIKKNLTKVKNNNDKRQQNLQ